MDFFLADLRMDLAWHGWYLGFFPPAHLQPDVCYFVRPTSWKIGFAVRQRPGHPSTTLKSQERSLFCLSKTKRNSSLFHLKPKLTRPSPRGPRGSLNSWLMQRVDRCQCAVLMHIAECTTPYTWSRARPSEAVVVVVSSSIMMFFFITSIYYMYFFIYNVHIVYMYNVLCYVSGYSYSISWMFHDYIRVFISYSRDVPEVYFVFLSSTMWYS